MRINLPSWLRQPRDMQWTVGLTPKASARSFRRASLGQRAIVVGVLILGTWRDAVIAIQCDRPEFE